MLRDKYGQTALIIVANMDGKYEARNKIASFLIEKGYDDLINIKDKSGASPFRYAARSNDDQMMELFIKKGLNIHEPVEEASGGTPLHFAAKYGKFSGKSVEMLINAGADVNAKDKRGRTPFSWYKSRHYINRDIGLALMSAGAK
jgi:ankyrin repeat protein